MRQRLRSNPILFAALALMLMYAISATLMKSDRFVSSDQGRIEMWKIAVTAFAKRPLLGWGPDTFLLVIRRFMTVGFIASTGKDWLLQANAHNDILQALVTTGLLGLGAYLFLLYKCALFIRDEASEIKPAVAGAILAAFVQAKVNPFPATALIVVAALLGSLWRHRDARVETLSRWRAAGGLLAALLSAAVIFRVFMAERCQHLAEQSAANRQYAAATQYYNVAAQWDPLDIHYVGGQIDSLWRLTPSFKVPGQKACAFISKLLSERALRVHPNDPVAHELRAMSYLQEDMAFGTNSMIAAIHEMSTAEELAPHFSQYAARVFLLKKQFRAMQHK